MKYAIRKVGLGTVFASLLALGACGGGDDNPPPVTSQVPADASTSIDGFINYLKALVVSSADTLEPVDINAVTPPVDETSEPTPLN